VRTAIWLSIVFALACAKASTVGPLAGGSANYPNITAIDSARPPKSVSVRLDQDAYIVVLLVAPGHSATLLYPRDSATDNHMTAGSHDLPFNIPAPLVRNDSANARINQRDRQRFDTTVRARSGSGSRNRAAGNALPPILANTVTYLLVMTSPQQLSYTRVLAKTAGVSIPLIEIEALNAVGKAIKSTLLLEPREYAGYFQQIALVQKK
jgi:hypothetical protein